MTASVQPRSQIRKPVPAWIYALLWVSLIPLLFGPNTGLTITGGLVLTALPRLLWRQGEAPTLLWICFYQWVQAFVPVVQAGIQGVTVAASMGGQEFEEAVLLSLLGVLFFSLGAACVSRIVSPAAGRDLPAGLTGLSPSRLFVAWVALALPVELVNRLLWGSSLSQLVQPLFSTYVAAMVLLFQYALATGRGRGFAYVLVAVEIMMGFVGYFGGFKLVLYTLLLAGLTFTAIRPRVWGQGVLIMILAAGLGNFWGAIKYEYRRFLAGETAEASQEIRVPLAERLGYMSRALQEMTWDRYVDAFGSTLDRIGYVTYLGHCLSNVPASVPHADGRLWKEAVMHVLMPRVLFPNKQEFNDSDRTNEFTGLRVADATQGTSIGLGYVGESYVDFGVPGMFVPIFLFGAAVGGGYALLVRLAPLPLLGAAFGTAMLMRSGFLLESSNAKMLGGLVITTGVYALLLHFMGGWLWRWIAPAGHVGAAVPARAGQSGPGPAGQPLSP